jgi:hypothetical protein
MVSNLPNTSVAEVLPAGAVFEAAHAVDKGDPKIDGPYLTTCVPRKKMSIVGSE